MDDFANKAIELLKNKIVYTRFSKNSIEHIFRAFNFQKSVSDLELFFEKIISG